MCDNVTPLEYIGVVMPLSHLKLCPEASIIVVVSLVCVIFVWFFWKADT